MTVITKQSISMFVPAQNKKKELIIPTDEGQSFADLLAQFDGKILQLKLAMNGRVTSKPWSIVNENDKKRDNAKATFRNLLQNLSPIPSSNEVPSNVDVSVVDAMRVVKMIPVNKISPRTFRRWCDNVFDYIKSLPGDTVHIVFDNYAYDYLVPSKDRYTGAPRLISSIDQERTTK